MGKRVLALLAALAMTMPAAGLAQSGAVMGVPAIAARVQAAQINEVVRSKVRHETELDGTGISGAKVGDEVELVKRQDGTVEVSHVPTGQVAVVPAAAGR